VLASDEDSSTLDALKFSLASDIVELVVLTADEVFLQTLREAVGGARRLWHVPSADKVSDLLVETKAIVGPLRMTRYEFGAARKKKTQDGRSNSMFASRDEYYYTEEELAEYEREQKESEKKSKLTKRPL